jgi:hypothetical protein
MGAHDFEYIVRNKGNVSDAYTHLREEAIQQHGQDPYNGTISTTSGYVMASSDAMTLAQARDFAQKYFNGEVQLPRVEKWGDAGAIPLLAESTEVVTRTKKITLDAVEYASFQKGNKDVITSELRILKGYSLVDYKVEDVDATIKVDTKATEGDRETRYFIEGDGMGGPHWENGYASQAEARDAMNALALAKKQSSIYDTRNQKWGTYAITRRSDGTPLVRTRRTTKRAVLTVEYRMEKVDAGRTEDGWYFFGWAAC